MNMMVRNPQWPAQGLSQDPIKHLFDRLLDGALFKNGSSDESSIVTSQWKDRGDIER